MPLVEKRNSSFRRGAPPQIRLPNTPAAREYVAHSCTKRASHRTQHTFLKSPDSGADEPEAPRPIYSLPGIIDHPRVLQKGLVLRVESLFLVQGPTRSRRGNDTAAWSCFAWSPNSLCAYSLRVSLVISHVAEMADRGGWWFSGERYLTAFGMRTNPAVKCYVPR
jgi:hypothetical protein